MKIMRVRLTLASWSLLVVNLAMTVSMLVANSSHVPAFALALLACGGGWAISLTNLSGSYDRVRDFMFSPEAFGVFSLVVTLALSLLFMATTNGGTLDVNAPAVQLAGMFLALEGVLYVVLTVAISIGILLDR